MTLSVDMKLSEAYRDALLAFYLHEVVPKDAALATYRSRLKSAEDVSAFLLVDTQVCAEVSTSRVAQAIASLQQYLGGVMMNLEPDQSATADEIEEWFGGNNRYPIWAANQQLYRYPQNFVEPALRQDKTSLFDTLEMSLSQGRIDADGARKAVQEYLTGFEKIANLKVISGYQFGAGTQSQIYLIGRTEAQPCQYFWRLLDLRYREPGSNAPTPKAWTEWKEVSIPIGGTQLCQVQPVHLNNRLYAVWAEAQDVRNEKNESLAEISFKLAYKQLDDGWSPPQTIKKFDAINGTAAALQDKYDHLVASVLPAGKDPVLAVALDKTTYVFCDPYLRPVAEGNSVGRFENYSKTGVTSQISADGTTITTQYNANSEVSIQDGEIIFRHTGGAVPSAAVSVDVGTGSTGLHFVLDQKNNEKRYDVAEFVEKYKDVKVVINHYIGQPHFVSFTVAYSVVKPETIQELLGLFGANRIQHDFHPGFNVDIGPASGTDNIGSHFNVRYDSEKSILRLAWFSETPRPKYKNNQVLWEDYVNDIRLEIVFRYEDGGSPVALYVRVPDGEQCRIHVDGYAAGVFSSGYHRVQSINPNQWLEWIYISNVYVSRFLHPAIIWSGIYERAVSSFSITGLPHPIEKEVVFNGQAEHSITVRIPRAPQAVQIELSVKDHTTGSTLLDQKKSVTLESIDHTPPLELKQTGGGARYLDVSSLKLGYDSLRLNTLFAHELMHVGHTDIGAVLSWETQLTQEPAIPGPPSTQPGIDFHGANSVYFWELFFHLPWLVAHRLQQEQRFDEARRWMHFIFDPGDEAGHGHGKPRYWNARPLVEDGSPGARILGPVDPDAIAVSQPEYYRKAIFQEYIRFLVERGDAAYRQLTNDSLAEAKQWYVCAAELLGPRPDLRVTETWKSPNLAQVVASAAVGGIPVETSDAESLPQPCSVGPVDPGLRYADTGMFRLTPNGALLDLWRRLEGRLENLRRNLTIDGKPLNIPLFAPPMSPLQLHAQGGKSGNGLGLALTTVSIPPYRFRTVWLKASSAVDTLIQVGNNLETLIERKERVALEVQQQQQVLDLMEFVFDLNEQATAAAKATLAGLTVSLSSAATRQAHYAELHTRHITDKEQESLDLLSKNQKLQVASSYFQTSAAILDAFPNVFGLANGGMRPAAPVYAVSSALQGAMGVASTNAYRLSQQEGYERRREEWGLQLNLAAREVSQINEQIAAQEKQIAYLAAEKAQSEQNSRNLREMLEFMHSRFSREEVFQWLQARMSSLYYQLYDEVVSLCLSAEAAWQFETGDYSRRFIQPGTWNSRYFGLLSGEALKVSLQRMDSAYMARHERRLEVVKTVSLRQLFDSKKEEFPNGWEGVLGNFRKNGYIDFSLGEDLFDSDYPGHYMRQIAWVSVYLPAVVGAYQDVRASLIQTGSTTIIRPDIDAVRHLLTNQPQVPPDSIKRNLRARQQITLSTGVDDSGQFVLNFGDERYLPFEGTGAVSDWRLVFPRHDTSESQKALLERITDVVLRIRYTSMDGDAAFGKSVEELLEPDVRQQQQSPVHQNTVRSDTQSSLKVDGGPRLKKKTGPKRQVARKGRPD